ncbi:glyoxalase/bleomycin resistance protein/dioxygenase superfamily protein [Idiomarina loihiensis]|uniref:VOC family protein n=1 Tax=Idiomarina TaxID=135575 RepID=UPI000D71D315|nr:MULTISPECIES: VOC family protein [Idiomarina]PWW40326.1 glyoxalase/bleomycin resistance protein/dioxygenase superfamily protein [Idiomarina loihiensis]TDP50017.1 glyoxalase/bleomycin resistance protein/dioxygenase superfamily protein [Idiomarina loihiensis]TDS24631.1 glyoxalase/bleomycin resistance protein/dioxygenase superfamily protein [Idiomarina sp. H2]
MNLNQVTMPSHDIDAAKAFYQGMGFILIVDTPHYLRFECPIGDATFSVSRVDSLAAADSRGVVVYFEFGEGELDEKAAELSAAGYEFEHMPQDKRYLWREAVLTDPSGNKLILYFAGVNRKSPPWRVKSEGTRS